MAPDDRKVKCTTRLDALDVPRSSAHKAKEFVGFRTLFSHLFVRGKIAWHTHHGLSLYRKIPKASRWYYRWAVQVIFCGWYTGLITGTCSCLFAKHPLLLHLLFRFKDHPTLNKRYLLLNLLGKGGFSEVYKVNYEVMNIWKLYMRTSGWRIIWKKIIAVIDTTFTVTKRKPEKNSGLYGIRTLDLRDTGASLLPIELTS